MHSSCLQLPEEGQKWGFLIWLLFSYCALLCIFSMTLGKVSISLNLCFSMFYFHYSLWFFFFVRACVRKRASISISIFISHSHVLAVSFFLFNYTSLQFHISYFYGFSYLCPTFFSIQWLTRRQAHLVRAQQGGIPISEIGVRFINLHILLLCSCCVLHVYQFPA